MAISDCYNAGNISSHTAGGIIDSVYGLVSISNCYNTGDVSSSDRYVGGITAWAYAHQYGSITIDTCYNTSNVSSLVVLGGICGRISGKVIVNNCNNAGKISSLLNSLDPIYAGGICGEAVSSSYGDVAVTDCHSSGEIFSYRSDSTVYSGGICGHAENSHGSVFINDCLVLSSGITATSTGTGKAYSYLIGYGNAKKINNAAKRGIKGNPVNDADYTIGGDILTPAPTNGFAVSVTDEEDRAVAGASVTVLNNTTTATTDKNGLASFENLTGSVRLSVSKEGYLSAEYARTVSRGSTTTVVLCPDDGKPHIFGVNAASDDGRAVDLLSGFMYFKSDKEKTPQTPTNTKKLRFSVNASAPEGVRTYQLIQSGKVVYESGAPDFDLTIITGKTDMDFGQGLRIEKLEAGKNVTLRIIDASGNAVSRKLGLRISDPDAYVKEQEGKLSVGSELKIGVSSDIPIIGDTEIEFGLNPVPFEIEVSEDGKIKIGINKPKNVDWDKMVETYNKTMAQSYAGKAFGGIPQSFGAGKVKIEASAMGYGEGYVSEDGSTVVNVGVIMSVSAGASYTQQFFLGWMPVYVGIGVKASLSGKVEISVLITAQNTGVSGGLGEIEPVIVFNINGGLGVGDVLCAGGFGRVTIDWLHRFSDNYDNVSLTGEMYLYVQAFMAKAEKRIASGTWTIYDSHGRTMRMLSAEGFNPYDSGAYRPIERDYLRRTSLSALDLSTSPGAVESMLLASAPGSAFTVFDYVFPNAMPRLVYANGRSYVFWLHDNGERTAENRTALVYFVSSDNEDWSAPVQVFPESEASTADFNFDLAVVGNDIHIVWTKAKEPLGQGTGLNETAAAAEIYRAKLDTDTGVVSGVTALTNDAHADMTPVVSDDDLFLAWITNELDGAEGLFGMGNTHSVAYAYTSNPDAVLRISASPGASISSLDAGTLNGTPYIAYVEDGDGNRSTGEDSEIRVVNASSGEITRLTEDETADTGLRFGRVNGVPALFWYADGDIRYTSNLTNIESVAGRNGPKAFGAGFALVPDEAGNSLIVWESTAEGEEGTDPHTSFYASSFDGSVWSPPYRIYDTESELTSAPNGFVSGDTAILTFLETKGVAEDAPLSAVKVAVIEPETDIALTNVSYDFGAVRPRSPLPLTLTIENKGSADADTINVYTGGNAVATINGAGLGPGETKEYVVDGFAVPADLAELRDFEISVLADSETELSDNARSARIGYADLSVGATRLLSDGDDYANVIVQNLGGIATDATLKITADSLDGTLLYEEALDAVSEARHQSLLINLTELAAETEAFYFTVEADKEELFTGDNTALVYIGMGAEDDYTLTVEAGPGGAAVGTAGGKYFEGDAIEISAKANPGYAFDGWSSSNGGDFEDASSPNTLFSMPGGDATVTANFAALPYTLGDVNGDNRIDMADATLVYRHHRGKMQLVGNLLLAADVNGDNAVNMADATLVYRYHRGKIAMFSVSEQIGAMFQQTI
ncbi:MAG: dockerin type I domain-containing protein [Clostridiales Family XIII bacterium]|nr:dockerin type I domain-containing protein [Clostridiales Family XIII bacterium]